MSAALAALRAHPLHRSVFLRATNNNTLLRPWLPRHADTGEPRRRNFTTPTPGHHPEKPASRPTRKIVASSVVSSTSAPRALPDPGPPPVRHEVQEGTASINMPFNPPGGGPAAAPGGFTFTNSPVLDAILTTAIGLAAGKYQACQYLSPTLIHNVASLRGRHPVREMVQEECP